MVIKPDTRSIPLMKRNYKTYASGNIRAGATQSAIKQPPFTREFYRSLPRGVTPAPRMTYTAAALSIPETKYYDISGDATPTNNAADWSDTEVVAVGYVNGSGVGASATAGNCCLIPNVQGTGYGQMQGNRYKIKAMRVRGTLKPAATINGSVALGSYITRLILVLDTQPNGAQAQGEEVMQDVGTADQNVHSYQNMAAFQGRFRVLKDKKFVLQPAVLANDAAATANLAQGWNSVCWKMAWKPQGGYVVTVKSNGSTPNVGQTVNCNVFLLQLSTIDGTIVGNVKNSFICRTYFVDP